MKIRRILGLSSWISACLVLLMLASLAWTSLLVSKGNAGLGLANEMRNTIFERMVLRDEYFSNREERARLQWMGRTDSLLARLDGATALFPEPGDAAVLLEMRGEVEKSGAVFAKMTESLGSSVPGAESLPVSEYSRKLNDQMRIRSYILIDDASLLAGASLERLRSLSRATNALLGACLLIMVALVLVNGVLIGRILSRGVQRLLSGASNIGRGDLEYRIDISADDEIGEIGREINHMAESLLGSFTSIQNLEREGLERRRAEEEARGALEENRVLLRELQHRAKNSFGMILNMIGLSQEEGESAETRAVLASLDARVRAVAELYSLLYSSGSFLEVRLDEYCASLASAMVGLAGNVSLATDMAPVIVSAKQAAPLGLIVTELITNSLKYAFPGGSRGRILLALRPAEGGGGGATMLSVEDDGLGLPPDFSPSSQAGLGLRLVMGLSEQVGGSFTISGGEPGTRCCLEFMAVGA